MWVDEEDKRFYEELRELRGEVPGSVLGVVSKEVEAEVEEKGGEGTEDEVEVGVEVEGAPEPEYVPFARLGWTGADDPRRRNPIAALAATDVPDSALPAGPAAQLTALFARLQDASSRATIDAIAVEFAFLNSKAARKRLIKVCWSRFRWAEVELRRLQFLGSVNRNRQDILPYYARLVGTLDPYMPDIGKELVALVSSSPRVSSSYRN